MEKVKIAEIDIGVDKLVAKTGEVKQEIERLRKSQKDLKKDTDGLTGATKEQLAEFTKAEIEIKNLNKEYRASNKVLDAYINIQNQEIHTINEARDANLKLIAIKNELDTENEDHIKLIMKINAEVDSNTDYIKENSSEYEKTKINIGNYKEAITGALGELGIFGKYQQGVNDVMKGSGPIITFVSTNLKQVKDDFVKASAATTGMSKAQIAAHLTTTALSAGLKILRIALIATGIGAIVVVLGSFIAYLATTQEGINKVNMVLTPLKEGFNAVLGSVQDLGKAFSKLFTLDFSGFLSDIKEIGGEMKNNIKEAVERGKEMETIQQGLNKSEADYITLQAKLRKEFEQQKKLAEDVNKPIAEREAAAQKAIEAQEEISKGSIERIKQEAQILKLKQMSNDTSDAERAELATKLAEIDKALEEEAAKTTEAQNKVNSIRKEGAAKQAAERAKSIEAAKAASEARIALAQKETDAAISENKTRLAIFIEENKGKADSLAEKIQLEEDIRDKSLEIFRQELEAKKLTHSEYDLAILQSKNSFLEKQTQLTADYAQKEIEIQLEKDDKLKEIEQLKAEAKVVDLQNKLEINRENFDLQYELELQRLEQRRIAEVEAAEKTGADVSLVNQKYAKIQEDIEFEKNQAKSAMAADTLGSIASALGEETELGKAAALAQALINTYLGITAGVKLGFPAMIPAIAAASVTGFGAVKNIVKTKTPKAAQGIGMDINGPSHSQGGVTLFDQNGNPLVEAQGGEKMVILKREASAELSALSALNQKHGGVNLSKPVSYAANGGSIIRNPTAATKVNIPKNIFDYEMLGSVLADKVNAVQSVVPVDQITNVAIKAARVERGANL